MLFVSFFSKVPWGRFYPILVALGLLIIVQVGLHKIIEKRFGESSNYMKLMDLLFPFALAAVMTLLFAYLWG